MNRATMRKVFLIPNSDYIKSSVSGSKYISVGDLKEDFQDLVFNVFARRLYREWYLFLDDLSVATGRETGDPDKPSGAADVWGCLDEAAASSVPQAAHPSGGCGVGAGCATPRSERRGSLRARRY